MGTYQAWAMTAQGRLDEAREALAAAEMAIKGDPQAADGFKRSLHYPTGSSKKRPREHSWGSWTESRRPDFSFLGNTVARRERQYCRENF